MFDKFRKKYAGEIEQAKKYTKAGIRGLNAAAKTMAEEREKRRASEQGKTVYSSESWPTGYISGDLREPTNIIGFFLTEGAPQPDRQVFNRKLYDK